MRKRMVLAGIFLVAVILAGCGATSPAATGTATPAPSPTTTPLPQVSYTDAAAACKGLSTITGTGPSFYRFGDLLVSGGAYYGIGLRKLPDNTPFAPLLMPDPNDQAALDARYPAQPAVNPIGMGFAVTLCNASKTQARAIEGVTVRITQFEPYTGTGRVYGWTVCDGYYTRSDPHGVVGGGCGYGVHTDEMLKVTYPANAATGMELAATWVSASDISTDPTHTTPWGPLPAMLPPGQFVSVLVSGAPTTTGMYTLGVAPTVDHTRLAFVPVGYPALFTGTLQKWTGEACLAPGMQGQIPAATTPTSYYICPEP